MIALHPSLRRITRLARDRSGNFAITTAFLMPVLIGVAGLAIDMTKIILFKNELQTAADTATLAAASAMAAQGKSADQAKALSLQFLYGQIGSTNQSGTDPAGGVPSPENEPSVQIATAAYNVTGKMFTVTMNARYNVPLSPFAHVLGYQIAPVSVSSTAQSTTETKNALSMYFVLDRSGSMGENTATTYTATCKDKKGKTYSCTAYYTKIESLKMASTALLAQLSKADPQTKYVRTGSVSYDSSMGTPLAIAWGTTGVSSYVNALTANGGTSSTKAFQEALARVSAASEDTAHKGVNGQIPTKYIVFMTDGDNNNSYDDTYTKTACDSARAKKIQVFSVAFMAPAKGTALLKYCATDTSHFFAAENTAQLVDAFKAIGEKAAEQMTRLTN
jgi:Flp pilus assembly protein TadG/uncharacterized protein YegL